VVVREAAHLPTAVEDGHGLSLNPRYVILSNIPTTVSDYRLATSVNVERVFSKGQILLSHLRSRLSVQSTRALMCIGAWSLMGYMKDNDIKAVTGLPEVDGNEEDLEDNWDMIE
jgi:hypothetical protein